MIPPPRPYQVIGAQFLAARSVAWLADDMGLGKSRQAIDAADLVRARNVAVVCPSSVRRTWATEFLRYQQVHRSVHIMDGRESVPRFGVSIASYDIADRLGAGVRIRFDVMILDEAHYLKNRTSRRSEAIMGISNPADWATAAPVERHGVASLADHVWLLTGTPMLRDPTDLYGILDRFFPDVLIRRTLDDPEGHKLDRFRFKRRYCRLRQTGVGRYVVIGGQRLPELAGMLRPIMLRRLTEDVAGDLPAIRFEHVVVEAKGAHRALDAVDLGPEGETLRKALAKFDAGDLTALDRISAHVATLRRLIGAAKVGPVAELLTDELEEAPRKIIVMAWHTEVLDGLHEALRSYGVVRVDGSTTPKKRWDAVDRFQKDAKVLVFLGQIRAAGEGLTLTAACEQVMVESSWIPAHDAQAVKRAHRLGQTRPVRVRYVSLAGSIDERVAAVSARRLADSRELFGAPGRELTLEELLS